MTSAKFLGFWTPSLPLVSIKSTQPPFLLSEISQPPPSPSLLTSFVNGPKELSSRPGERARKRRGKWSARKRERMGERKEGIFWGPPPSYFLPFLPIFSHLFPGQTFILNAVLSRPRSSAVSASLSISVHRVRMVGMKSVVARGENRIHIMNCRCCQAGGGGGIPRGEELWDTSTTTAVAF